MSISLRRRLRVFAWVLTGAAIAGGLWLLLVGRETAREVSHHETTRSAFAPARARRRLSAVGVAATVLVLLVAIAAALWWARNAQRERERWAMELTRGDLTKAPALVTRYGCGACHTISGIAGAIGLVGPPLDGVGQRVYVAGMLLNTPENITAWIVNPRGVNPKTAMPVTGITEREARDVAAFLYATR